MLKKFLDMNIRIIIILVSVILLVQIITSYTFGFVAQNQFDKQFKHFISNAPLIKVQTRDYHRGIFSSDVTTKIAVNSQELNNLLKLLPNNSSSINVESNSVYSITYVTHISQGLFAGAFSGNFIPKFAYATTTIEFSDSLKNILNKFFNGKQPLIISDTLYLNKSGKLNFASPSFNYEEAVSGVKVIWGGLRGDIKYNQTFNQFNSQVSIPSFELIAPTKGNLVLQNFNYTNNSTISPNKISVGTSNLNLDKIAVEWKDKIALNFKMGDVLKMLTGISSTQFLNSIDVINPNGFTLNNVGYSSTSHDVNNLFGASAQIKFASLVTNNTKYGPLNIDLSVDHILSSQFSKLADDIEQFTANSNDNNDDQRDAFIKVLKANFGPILVNTPIFNLNKFKLQTPSGLIDIKGFATTNNFSLGDMEDQTKFMNKLNIDFNYSIPKPIISYLFVLQMKYLLTAGNAELDQQSSAALTKVVNILLDNQISTWTKKGYLKNNNGILSSHFVIKDGKMVINGIPDNNK